MQALRRGILYAVMAALIGLGTVAVASPAQAQRVEVRVRRPQIRAEFSIGTRRVVRVAPPIARVEVRPAQPAYNTVWQPGYWSWNGYQHVWVSGRWVEQRRGYAWQQPRWEQRSGGWYFVPGTWIVQQQTPPPPPVVTYTPPPPTTNYGYYGRDNDHGYDRNYDRGQNYGGYSGRYDNGYDGYDDDNDGVDESTAPLLRFNAGVSYGPRRIGRRGGFAIWVDPSGVWHLRAASRRAREFSGRVRGENGSSVRLISTSGIDGQDQIQNRGTDVRFDLSTYGTMEGIDFVVDNGSCARFRLQAEDDRPKSVSIGMQRVPVQDAAFVVCR